MFKNTTNVQTQESDDQSKSATVIVLDEENNKVDEKISSSQSTDELSSQSSYRYSIYINGALDISVK
jgi:hypothetical protein